MLIKEKLNKIRSGDNYTEKDYRTQDLLTKLGDITDKSRAEHFTPLDIVDLMLSIVTYGETDGIKEKSIYDCAAGTGGMLNAALTYFNDKFPNINLNVYSQEINKVAYSICRDELVGRGVNKDNIRLGNTLSNDLFKDMKFDYMVANPPFGVSWKEVQREIKSEHKELGFDGRFGAGLPRVSDGTFLFLQHLVSKMNQSGTSRIAVIYSASPLFVGSAGSGESKIRQWVIENDMLETIIALPDKLFYNTSIHTYVWIITNHKDRERKDKIQLINGVDYFKKITKKVGGKHKEITQKDIETITQIYSVFKENKDCKIINNAEFRYEDKGRTGYEISFNRYFIESSEVEYRPPLEILGNIEKNNKEIGCIIDELKSMLMEKDIDE